MLAREKVRAFYQRLGPLQDLGGIIEQRAVDDLVAHASFGEARAVFELGCGTGRLAERLLARHLPPSAVYRGIDLTPRMVGLARRRLRRFGGRAAVELTGGEPRFETPAGSFDRFVSTYVFDLLPEDEIRAVLAEAQRILTDGGLLGVVALCPGCTATSRFVTRTWNALNSRAPAILGGCRPIVLAEFLSEDDWDIRHAETVVQCGFPSSVVVASAAGRTV